MNKYLSYFLLISVAHLTAIALGFEEVRFFTKTLLMPSLLLYFWKATKGIAHPTPRFIRAALVASFLGDVFLIFADNPKAGQTWFLAGLGSFLLAQLWYAFGFQRFYMDFRQWEQSAKPIKLKVFLLPLSFFCLMISTIWSGLPGDLQVPVVIYGLAIATMVGAAMILEDDILKKAFWMIFLGAVLFMCSDSLIALDKFTDKLSGIWKPTFWIMLTYILGQAGIVIGLVKALSARWDSYNAIASE